MIYVFFTFILFRADSIVTDLDDFIPLMDRNISSNQHLITGKCKASTLRWGEDMVHFKPPDYLLLADCIYYPEVLNLKQV